MSAATRVQFGGEARAAFVLAAKLTRDAQTGFGDQRANRKLAIREAQRAIAALLRANRIDAHIYDNTSYAEQAQQVTQ